MLLQRITGLFKQFWSEGKIAFQGYVGGFKIALQWYISEIQEEWIAVEYSFYNYILWVVGIMLIGFPVVTLAIIRYMVYLRDSAKKWKEMLSRRRLAIDYR